MIEYNTLSLVVEGYPGHLSYRPGEEAGIAGSEQPVPTDAYSSGCGWPATFTFPIPNEWCSGFYEYWSWGMRDTADAHLARGGNFAMFSGNAVWQVRYEDEGRTMLCHKCAARERDQVMGTGRQHLLTSIWSDPLIERSENLTTGLSFCRGGYAPFGRAVPRSSGAYTIWRPKHWVDLGYGYALGLGSYIVAYEIDGCELALREGVPYPTSAQGTAKDMEMLATAPAHLLSNGPDGYENVTALTSDSDAVGDLQYTAELLFGEASSENVERLTNGHAVIGTFRHPGGGTVFNAGTADWAYGLDQDRNVQQVTRNVLTRLGETRPPRERGRLS